MLQPRLINGKRNSGLSVSSKAMDGFGSINGTGSGSTTKMCVFAAFFLILLNANVALCKDIFDTEPIDVSRIRRDTGPAEHAFNSDGIIYDNSPWRPAQGRDLEFANDNSRDEIEEPRRRQNLATRIMSNGVGVVVAHGKSAESGDNDSSEELYQYFPSPVKNNGGQFAFSDKVIQNNIIKMEQTNYLNKPLSSATSKDKRIDDFQNKGSDEQSQDLIQPSEVGPVTTCLTSSCSCSHAKTESLADKKQKTKYIDNNEINNDYSTSTQLKRSPLKTSKYGATPMDISPTRLQNGAENTHYGPYNYENTKMTPADKIVEKYTEVLNDSEESLKNKTPELLTNEQASDEDNSNKKPIEVKKPEKTKEKPPKINKTKFPVADLLKLGSLGIKSLSQLAPVFEKMTGGFIKRQDDAKSTTTIKPVNKLTQYSNNVKVDSGENIRRAEPKVGNFPIYIPVDEMETSASQNIYANTTLHQNLAWAAEHKHLNSHFKKSIHESPLLNGGIPISPGEIITTNSDVIVGKPAVGGPITFNHIAKPNMKVMQANLDLLDSQAEGNIRHEVKERPPKQMSTQKQIPFINDNDSFDLRPPILSPLKPRLPPKDSNFQRHQAFLNKPSNSRPNSYNNQFNTPIRRPQENEMHKHVRPDNNDKKKPTYLTNENKAQTVGHVHSQDAFFNNHGRPALLDFIPSLNKPIIDNDRFEKPSHHIIRKDNEDYVGQPKFNRSVSSHISFDNPNTHVQSVSSEFDLDKQESDIVLTQVFDKTTNRPFLVDIQPSRVANVLIPHGSSTALIFAGSSEPHKTGDYVDDPLPYPEPGYFGSFSIDAPQMTMVHNVAPTSLNKPNFQMNQRKEPPNEIPPRNSFSNTSNVSFQGSSNNKWKNVNNRPQNYHQDFKHLPAPTSNQEINIQVGPHIALYNTGKHNPANFDLTKHTYKNNQAGMYKGKQIDREYEKHLAVPPPPPSRPNYETNKGPGQNADFEKYKNRPLAPKTPTFHTKPIQDMSVFLNIEHPIPMHSLNQAFKDGIPQKITSEIYFAAPTPQNIDQIKPFTVHLPANYKGDKLPNFEANLNSNQAKRPQSTHTFQYPTHINIQDKNVKPLHPKYEIKFPLSNDNFDHENSYGNIHLTSIPENSKNNEKSEIVGTSIAVPIGSGSHKHIPSNINTAGIPIGTNVAIKVEDNPISFNTYGTNGQLGPTGNYFNGNTNNPEIIVGDNQWQAGSIDNFADKQTQMHYNKEDFLTKNFSVQYPQKENFGHVINEPVQITEASSKKQTINVQIIPSDEVYNSHANFPMIKDSPQTYFNDETSTNKISVDGEGNKKRPPKLIPNISTNSHGWFSDLQTESPKYNLNLHSQISDSKTKIESTTHTIIPLTHSSGLDSNKKQNIFFGNKIPSVGVPPSKIWHQNTEPVLNLKEKPLINKRPSNKDKEGDFIAPPPLTTQSYNPGYIPGNYGANSQPAYDIPIRDDNYYHSTTHTPSRNTIKTTQDKPLYETADEVYDSLSEQEEPYNDGEISSESMKIPVISSKSNHSVTSTSEKPLTNSKNEIAANSENEYVTVSNESGVNGNLDDNYGMQTEKAFMGTNYNKLPTHASMDAYSTERNSIPYRDRVRPKPFDVYTLQTQPATLSHKTHWQINNLAVNNSHKDFSTNLVLNIGEVVRPTESNKVTFTTESSMLDTNEDIMKVQPIGRPTFSLRPNNESKFNNEQVINTPSRESMIVYNMTSLQPPAQTQTTIEEINNLATEIINLSPPPPTLDYSFQPTHTEETIMGLNPPPPQSSVPSRIPQTQPPPTRTPLVPPPPPKTIQQPVRTPAVPVRTLPPPIRTPPPSIRTTPSPIRTPSKPIRTPAPSRNPPQLPRAPISQNRTSTTPRSIPQRTLPPRTLPPRTSPPKAQPPRVSIPLTESEEASTYRPNYDIIKNKTKRPGYVRTKIISKPVTPSTEIKLEPDLGVASISRVVFPTLQSSGWLTSENVHFPDEDVLPSFVPPLLEAIATVITSDTSTIQIAPSKTIHFKEDHVQFVRPTPVSKMPMPVSKHAVPMRKPIEKPAKLDDNIIVESNPKPVIFDNIVHKTPPIYRPTLIIEGSEKVLDDSYLKPTEILKDSMPISETMIVMTPTIVQSNLKDMPNSKAHPAPSKAVYADRNIPKPPIEDKGVTKTEIKTIAKTLTKILNEPPTTISTTRFVTLTHTLTVTHTKTSLISQSAGAMTQTLILTNTHTSTVVDVVTEIHTQVRPTTIVETITKHIPITTILPSPVSEPPMKTALDDISMSSEEDNPIIHHETESTTKKIVLVTEKETKKEDTESFFVVMNKSQGGGSPPPVNTDSEPQVEFDGAVRDEDVRSNGVSQVLFGEILLAGTPYLEATHVVSPTGAGYGKECQPDCKASRNERCQRMEGLMKCICRPGFARMFPDRPCKPTYTYSVKLALSKYGNKRLLYQDILADQTSKEFQNLAMATHEGINRMVMQSDLRDVYHGVHINGFLPVEISRPNGTDKYTGVINDFYVQLSDNAHETRLKEVIEKYLRTNNYSLGGTDVFAAGELVDKLDVSDFNECLSNQFNDCSEHAECFNLRGTYTCSCKEGYADLSVNPLYPGRICSAEPVGCERCNYHGACYTRDDDRVLCECFQWYAGESCHINLKVILISLATLGAILTVLLVLCVVMACSKKRGSHTHSYQQRPPPQNIVTSCIQGMPSIHQGGVVSSKQHSTHDRRALITERTTDSGGETSSLQNASLPYMPSKKVSQASSHKTGKKMSMVELESGGKDKKPFTLMIPRAKYHPPPPTSPLLRNPSERDLRDSGIGRKTSMEQNNEAKLLNYLEAGQNNDEMIRRNQSTESSYSLNKSSHPKHHSGALVSAGFKVSTTVKPDLEANSIIKEGLDDDASTINKVDYLDGGGDSRFNTLGKAYSQDDMTEWTDAERRIGELTMSEARSFDGTLVKPPTKLVSRSTCGSNKSSARFTQHEANTMAERDLGSTFLLPHVHLYKPELGSDMSEFDSL